MTINPLPDSPNLENLKKRAKALLKSVHSGEQASLDLIGPYFGNPRDISLQQAHLVIARTYGFSSWNKLKNHIEGTNSKEGKCEITANKFLDLVTVAYGSVPDFGPKRFEQAKELLAENPEIEKESIYTAAAIGDVNQINYWLNRDKNLINKKGGYFNWEPIMYAAYARLPDTSTLEAGLYLLQRGANPNAFYMWGGQYKFTALTGVFGHGEGGPVNQPEHPDYIPFARALLEAGADPNDSQAAYNRFFNPDNTCLELLLEYGLKPSDKNNWLDDKEGNLVPTPNETMHYQLIQAIKNGYIDRVKLLVKHGVDIEKISDYYNDRTKGKTPYHTALICGQKEIAEILLESGAKNKPLSAEDSFQVACMDSELETAQRILDNNPDLLSQINQRDMLCDAIILKNISAVRTMIDLGFDVNAGRDNTALHQASFHGDVSLVQMLLDAGADTTIRDKGHFATPLGFALYAENKDVITLLDTQEMDIFTAASRGKEGKVKQLLSNDPSLLDINFSEIRPGDKTCPNDWLTPLANAVLANQESIVRFLLEQGANPRVKDKNGKSIHAYAKEHASKAIVAMIEKQLG